MVSVEATARASRNHRHVCGPERWPASRLYPTLKWWGWPASPAGTVRVVRTVRPRAAPTPRWPR